MYVCARARTRVRDERVSAALIVLARRVPHDEIRVCCQCMLSCSIFSGSCDSRHCAIDRRRAGRASAACVFGALAAVPSTGAVRGARQLSEMVKHSLLRH